MDVLTIVLIATGLAMDAFAVSIVNGIALKSLRCSGALKIAISFGSFQAVMPVIGWLAGLSLKDFITGIDHWIAFALLSVIGCKMIYEATTIKKAEQAANPLTAYVLLVLSVATSIDALVVGLSFAFLRVSIAAPALVIGSITFLLSFVGVFLGGRFGHLFESKIEVLGGLVLIGIGTKILLEHLGYLF